MESENFIFLSLFFSLVFALWGNTNKTSSQALVGAENFSMSVLSQNSKPFFNLLYFKDNFCFFFSAILVFLANSVLSIFLLQRWIESGYPPFSNLYESLLFLTWALLFLYFPAIDFFSFIKVLFNIKSEKEFDQSGQKLGLNNESLLTERKIQLFSSHLGISKKVSSLIGMLLVSASLFIYTFSIWLLPSSMKEIKPLVPALKSNWLLMHVSIMLLSYSALLAGSLFSILYLVIFYWQKTKLKTTGEMVKPSTVFEGTNSSMAQMGKANDTELKGAPSFTSTSLVLLNLDTLSYRSLGFAFPLLTLGIISGSVWANEAWGSYWSWDPKETWALITWFIYSIYLHLRIQKSWGGEKAAWVGSFGFFVVWVCYLGVNLLGKGLHSYGWWN